MSARRLFPAFALTVAFVVAMLSVEACKQPTQMTLDISYQGGTCGRGVAILAGTESHKVEDNTLSRFYAAQTVACDSAGHIGTLVVTPADGSGHGAIMIIAGIQNDPTSCTRDNGYAGCIVARRAFAFEEHTSLVLPITLDPSCLDVPCGETSSCKSRQCVSSEVTCKGDICADYGLSPDGGDSVIDASTSDAATDGSGADAKVDSGVDSGNGGPQVCGTHGECPPYGGGAACIAPLQMMACDWRPDQAKGITGMCEVGNGGSTYDQKCTSDKDCVSGFPLGASCCSVSNTSTCMSTPCTGVVHLCVTDCDCDVEGKKCDFTPTGMGLRAPPFIKTCSR